MGKKGSQREFEAFADEQNSVAPFRHTLRGMGLNGNPTNEHTPEKKLDLLVEDVGTKVEAVLIEQIGSIDGLDILSLRTLLAANIRPLLKPLVKDDQKGTISMLDVVTLGLTETPDVKKFLKRHGSDLDNFRDLRYVDEVLREAIVFFDEVIARTPQEKVHPALKNTSNADGISQIFKTAAGKNQKHLVPQACALLRITAAIDFLNRDPLLALLPEAQAELKRKYNKHFTSAKGKTYFKSGNQGEVPMEIIKAEQRVKDRMRMIAKLLHKPQNSTKEVVDHVGMRVTTKSASDALRFLYYGFFMKDTAMFPGMTIRIGEGKQLLLDPDKLMEALRNPRKAAAIVRGLSVPTSDHSDLTTVGDESDGLNKYSSKKYRAIQLTFDMPITTQDGKRAHFPVEIQIVDQASREVNEQEAPHDDYMKRQTEAVRARILLQNNILARFTESKEREGDEE